MLEWAGVVGNALSDVVLHDCGMCPEWEMRQGGGRKRKVMKRRKDQWKRRGLCAQKIVEAVLITIINTHSWRQQHSQDLGKAWKESLVDA